MAYYDAAAARRRVEQEENFKELKKFISKSKNNTLSKWLLAYEHILDMENKMQSQEKKLEEYAAFFASLAKFLPKQFSVHDRIF